MAIKIINANLEGGDAVTADTDLIFKIYNGATDTLIKTTGSHTTDSDVVVSGDIVVISNVEVGVATSIKIASVDEAGNESPLSDAFGNYLLRIGGTDNYLFEDTDSYSEVVDPKTTDYEFTVNPLNFAAAAYLVESGEYNKSTCGRFYMNILTTGEIKIGRADPSNANAVAVTSTDTLTAGVDNTISLINGVLLVNGVDQLIDISSWGTITNRSIAGGGTTFFATELAGQGGFVGDIKAVTYKGASIGFTSTGLSFGSFNMTEYGTKTMVQY